MFQINNNLSKAVKWAAQNVSHVGIDFAYDFNWDIENNVFKVQYENQACQVESDPSGSGATIFKSFVFQKGKWLLVQELVTDEFTASHDLIHKWLGSL